MYLQRSYPHGKIDKQAYHQGFALKQKMKGQSSTRGGEWNNVGPINVGGRIVDIEGTSTALYVCAASGGMFKTTDNGSNWTPIFDNEITLSIGDLAISSTNEEVLYVGTGEANGGGGSLVYDGEGVFKSTDGGNTWNNVGLQEAGSIGRVAIDPIDDNIVFVAAMGYLFSENEERGIFRTQDGGVTWENVLYSSSKTGGIDVVIDPGNPDIVYAALWERERLLYDRTYGGPTSGIFKSEDGGDTWTELTVGLPTSDMGRIGLALAPSNPDVLYATITEPSGELNGIYRTANGGSSWEQKSYENITTVSFMYWFGRIKVHPTDEDIVYHVGYLMNKSCDGASSWDSFFPWVHVDQHEVWIDPNNPDRVYVGNDGGVYYSDNGGLIVRKFENLPITQFYRCEIDFLEPTRIYGGTQDNGTIRTLTASVDDWHRINGGDGFTPLVDPTDNNYVYVSSQYGNFRRSETGGNNFMSATIGIFWQEPKNWNTPYVFDPNNPEILYYGSNHLYRSPDRALTWSKISEDLSNGPYSGVNPFGTLTSISVSPFNSDQILVGTDDGNVWITNDLGESWELLSDELPVRWVTSVNHHPTIENRIYVTFSGYRYGENSGYVYQMDYETKEWISMSDGLPQVPVNDLLIIPKTGEIVVASDLGVFIYNEDDSWQLLSSELPNLIITDLDYHEPLNQLLVATYGRSMFTYTFDENVGTSESVNADAILFFPNPATSYLDIQVVGSGKIEKAWISNSNGINTAISTIENIENDQRIDISTLPSGNYFLNAMYEGEVISKPFVVVSKN